MHVDLSRALCAPPNHPELSWLPSEAEVLEQTCTTDYGPAMRLCTACPERANCAVDAVQSRDAHTVRAGYRVWLPAERAQLVNYLNREGIDPWNP